MIIPTKYLQPETCVLRVASELLSEFRSVDAIPFDECDELVRARIGEDARFNTIVAIDLLYLLGCLDYDLDNDMLVSISDSYE